MLQMLISMNAKKSRRIPTVEKKRCNQLLLNSENDESQQQQMLSNVCLRIDVKTNTRHSPYLSISLRWHPDILYFILSLVTLSYMTGHRQMVKGLFIYFIYYWFYIPPTCAVTSERSTGSRVWCSGPFSGF